MLGKNLGDDDQYQVKVSYNNVYVKICPNSVSENDYACDYSVFKTAMGNWSVDYVSWCGIELPGQRASDSERAKKTANFMYAVNSVMGILVIVLGFCTLKTKRKYEQEIKTY